MPRQATNRILAMVEDGLIDAHTVLVAALKYMSEAEVADMCHCNDFFADPSDDTEE